MPRSLSTFTKTQATGPYRAGFVAILAGLAATLTIALSFDTAAARPSPEYERGCLPPGTISDYIVAEYKALMGRSDAAAMQLLTLAAVPKVAVSAVVLVSDTTRCRRAAEAYSAAMAADSNRLVHVVRVGARHIVVDPAFSESDYITVTFDSVFSQPPLAVNGR